ncbi:MAG: GIY-YIG nuclease family protein, partial [Paraclostridium sp.]
MFAKQNQLTNYSVYVYVYSNNIVYVGISNDPHRRDLEHRHGLKSNIGAFLRDLGHSTDFVVVRDGLTHREALKLELKLTSLLQPEFNVYKKRG